MDELNVNVAIIGAGSAGLNAMGKVRASGKSFVLINGGPLGTTCARVGCMPSKVLIQVAEDFHRRNILGRYGVEGHKALTIDLEEAMEYVRDLRDIFVERTMGNSTDRLPAELLIDGYVRFVEPHVLEVGERRVRADKIIIATGSTPVIPAPWREFGDRIVTTDELFELETLPASMAVIGLGVIGLEIGQSLARLGVEVTGFDLLEQIGGLEDPAVQKAALEILGREFPLHLGTAAEVTAEGDQLRVTAGDQSVVVDKVFASLGRRPNLAGLALENAGIEVDEHGMPAYDPQTMQIGDSHIFIAGDVNADRPILHEAGDEGRIAGINATSDRIRRFRRKVPLAINFSDPNLCQVGARWSQLDHDTVAVGEVKMAPVGRALVMGKNKGLIRLYADRATGRMLGAEMACTKGENLAHLLAWSIAQELTVADLLRMPFYHPVIEEALQAALYDLYAKVDAKADGPLIEVALLD